MLSVSAGRGLSSPVDPIPFSQVLPPFHFCSFDCTFHTRAWDVPYFSSVVLPTIVQHIHNCDCAISCPSNPFCSWPGPRQELFCPYFLPHQPSHSTDHSHYPTGLYCLLHKSLYSIWAGWLLSSLIPTPSIIPCNHIVAKSNLLPVLFSLSQDPKTYSK